MGILNRKPDRLEWQGALTVPIHSRMTWDLMQRMIQEGRPFHYRGHGILFDHASLWIGDIPKARRPRCGARIRKGTPCRAPAVDGKGRCRLHGGLSTGPKTAQGRARIAQSNRPGTLKTRRCFSSFTVA